MPIGIYLHHKGYHRPKEIRNKISEGLKGKHPTIETRKKMSNAHKGKISNHKGKHPSNGRIERIKETINEK